MLMIAAMALSLGVSGPVVSTAQACPMCKIANEQDSRLPRAYMYSILFMMGMMFTLGGGVGVGMYFLSRKENAALDALEGSPRLDSGDDAAGSLAGGLQPSPV
jgi:hypothetical protein